MHEAARHESAIREARVAEDGIGKLDPFKHAVGERYTLAIQLRPAVAGYPQRGYGPAGADLLGERVDVHV